MKAIPSLVLVAAAFAAGWVASPSAQPETAEAPRARVVVKSVDGGPRDISVEAAADEIARLESALRRNRARAVPPETEDGADSASDESSPPPPPPPPDAQASLPRKADGTAYTFPEIRELALSSPDPAIRKAALRALRNDDSVEARRVLNAALRDTTASLDVRAEAAKSLSRAPHRDSMPDELLTTLSEPGLDPSLRRELAAGVRDLRDRGAWMPEVTALLGKENDPEVRRLLFESVQRTAWDPAARRELLEIAASPSANAEERRLAAASLARQGLDRRSAETLRPLLTSADPALRESALAVLSRSKALSPAELGAALADTAPAVRAGAFAAGFPSGKDVPKESREALLVAARQALSADSDADVRRSALQWINEFSKKERGELLASARTDTDPLVRLAAFSRSPETVVRGESQQISAGLESTDARVRDAAYRLIVQTWKVDVPFRAGWNAKARERAVAAIREAMAK